MLGPFGSRAALRKAASSRGIMTFRKATRRSVNHLLGLTLVEVVIALALGCLIFGGILLGYVQTTDRAEWSSYSLAAQSLAMQALEQARGGKWDPNAWPPVDEMRPTNFTSTEVLDVPVAGKPVFATNYVSITAASANPPLRQIQVDCVWGLATRRQAIRGPFTNRAVTLRACDQ